MGICFSLVCDVISMLFSSDAKIVDEILLEYDYTMPKLIYNFYFEIQNSVILFLLVTVRSIRVSFASISLFFDFLIGFFLE